MLALLALNILGLFSIASLSSLVSLIIMMLFSIFISDISFKNKQKVYARMAAGFFIFLIIALQFGLIKNITNRLIENRQEEIRADYFEDVAGFGGREEIIKDAYAFFKKSSNREWIR